MKKRNILIVTLILAILIVISLLVLQLTNIGGGGWYAYCGNNICESSETEFSCREDCGDVFNPNVCGNGVCETKETQNSCPDDCGLPIPVCGDGECVVFTYNYGEIYIDEWLSCPEDCGIICGDGRCTIEPYDERQSCPQDCDVTIPPKEPTNDELIYKLAQENRPLVGGLQIKRYFSSDRFSVCSLGAIISTPYGREILTAAHCISEDINSIEDSIGSSVKQGDEIVGTVRVADTTGKIDVALINIQNGVSSELRDFIGNSISGMADNVFVGQKVYKIGPATGLTYGTVSSITGYYLMDDGTKIRNFAVTGDNGMVFCKSGDSGSAIVTRSEPHEIVGIISTGNNGVCHSNFPQDIKAELGI